MSYLKTIFCLLVCSVVTLGSVYADGENSDDDWSTYDDEDGWWGDENSGSDYSASSIATRQMESIAEGYPESNDYLEATGLDIGTMIQGIVDNWTNPEYKPSFLSGGTFDADRYFVEQKGNGDLVITADYQVVRQVGQVTIDFNNSTAVNGGFLFEGITVTRPSHNDFRDFNTATGHFVFSGGIDNHDGTTTYTSIFVEPNQGEDDVRLFLGDFESVQSETNIDSNSSSGEITLPPTDNYDLHPSAIDDESSGGSGSGERMRIIPLEDIATRANTSGNGLISNGIVLEDPPFTYRNYTTLEISNLTKSYNIIPEGHILMDDLGVVGTYQLIGDSNSIYYNAVKIWLDVEGVTGIDNLEINYGRSHQTYLQSHVLPPQYGWSEDEALVKIAPTAFIAPGDSFVTNINITIPNALNSVPNGAGDSGVIFNDDGSIKALYNLDGKDTNGDGTKTYNEIEIVAISVLTPFELLEFKVNPMTEANGNDYSFDVPYHTGIIFDYSNNELFDVEVPTTIAEDDQNETEEEGREKSKVGGTSASDSKQLHEDILNVMKDSKFSDFKILLKRGQNNNKKTFDKITQSELESAILKLGNDEDAIKFVRIIANTINSDMPVTFTYYNKNTILQNKEGTISSTSTSAFVDVLIPKYKNAVLEGQGFIDTNIIAGPHGGGITTTYKKGTHSVLTTHHPKYAQGVTSLHEIFGHGRPISLGRTTTSDEDAIRFENLVWRLLGEPEKQRDGSNHGNRNGKPLPNPQLLPNYE